MRIFVAAAICNVILAVSLFLLLRCWSSSIFGAPMTIRRVCRAYPRRAAIGLAFGRLFEHSKLKLDSVQNQASVIYSLI